LEILLKLIEDEDGTNSILEQFDWEYFISGFFDQLKYCSIDYRNSTIFLRIFAEIVKAVIIRHDQDSLVRLNNLNLAHDLLMNASSRFANRPFARSLLILIDQETKRPDSVFKDSVLELSDWKNVVTIVQLETKYDPMNRFTIPKKQGIKRGLTEIDEIGDPPVALEAETPS
jgi:hypothetical protein